MAALNFVWYFVADVINFYEDFNTKYFIYQFINVLKNTVILILVSVLFIFGAKENLFTRNFILILGGLIVVSVSMRIFILRLLLGRVMGKGKNLKNLLIIGAGETGQNFKQLVEQHDEFGLKFIGFVDNNSTNENIEILSELNDLENVLVTSGIEVAVVALSVFDTEQLDKIMKACNRHAVRVHIIPDYFKFISKKFQINMIGDFHIITVRTEPLSEIHWRFIKRIFDMLFSLIVFVVIFWWLFPLIFILNLFYSNGPLLFIQERIGSSGKPFRCYKFRTMYQKRKKDDSFEAVVENDPRVTRLGGILRRTNIDELPQFINVFKGEMSVVGPRPHMISFQKVYEEMVDKIRIRGWVKPGITGWAQIHGLRGDVPEFEENKKRMIKRIDYDLWYIENWSLWLDVQIIILTVWQMLKGDTKGI